jgi:hypothetical protein
MATIINDKDKILQSAVLRLPAASGVGIFFSNPAPIFKITDDVATPSSQTITALFQGQLAGTVTWSVISGTITSTAGQAGNTWTLQSSHVESDSATIRATLVYLGAIYTADVVVYRIFDGSTGEDAISVALTATNQIFVVEKNTGIATPATTTLTATTINMTNPSYVWRVDGVIQTGQTSNSFTVSSFTSGTKLVRVDATSGGATVFDLMTIYSVKEGDDSLQAGLVNENQTISCNSAGTPLTGQLPVSSQLIVLRGADILTSGVVYSKVSETNMTSTINATTGVISATAISANFASATYRATVGTTTLDRTLTLNKSLNGAAGTSGSDGDDGIITRIAYQLRAQNLGTPAYTTSTTGGTTLPGTGWQATAPTATVGSVVWYSYGRFNPNFITVNGVAANTTVWSEPIAASIFQDIRSDNWNGSNPPTLGSPSSYGTAGYYISRNTGNIFANNGSWRGDLETLGDAYFEGRNNRAVSVRVAGSNYSVDYSGYGLGNTNPLSGRVRSGLLGVANSGTGRYNIGVVGKGQGTSGTTNHGVGVVGQGDHTGGAFYSNSLSGAAIECQNIAGTSGVSLYIVSGQIKWGPNDVLIPVPPNNTTTFLRGDGQWIAPTITSSQITTALGFTPLSTTGTAADSNSLGGFGASSWARFFATNSGVASAGGQGINLVGSGSSGIADAYVGTSGSGNTVTLTVQTTSPSDVRLKEEIENIDVGLAFVNQLRPVSYKLKNDPKHQKGYGFIADEVEELVGLNSSLVYFEPNWKVGDITGFKTVHYPSYISVLTKAVQELSAQVTELQQQVSNLQTGTST